MDSRKMQKAVSVTCEAHQAPLDLKNLVDTATQKTRGRIGDRGSGSQQFAARRCSQAWAYIERRNYQA